MKSKFKEAEEFPSIVRKYEIENKLGKGGQGTCYKALNMSNGLYFALKVIKLATLAIVH